MLLTVRAEKTYEKRGHGPSFHVSFLSYGPKLSKKIMFCIYASESSHYTISENDMVYRPLSQIS